MGETIRLPEGIDAKTRAAIEEIVAKSTLPKAGKVFARAAKAYPRFVFSREHEFSSKDPGDSVRIENVFGDVLGGTIEQQVSEGAFVVVVQNDERLVVHERHEAWKGP